MDKTALLRRLRLPVVASPMFIASGIDLVVAQCKAGIVGSFPALNARPADQLDRWIGRIEEALAQHDSEHPQAPAAPHAVNLILHKTNDRLESDLATCVRRKVPIVITSVGNPAAVVDAVHGYGGLVFHDVIHQRHARKAAQAGVDGLILVCAGAGGHAGRLSPFALVGEVRDWFQGLILLGGAITTGDHVLAAQALGADLAYMGTRFLATPEAQVQPAYKEAVLAASAEGIVYSDLFSGVHANYLRSSIATAGYDPDKLPAKGGHAENFGSESMATSKVWRDIWSAGQGVGRIREVLPAADVVTELRRDYAAARQRLAPGHS
ncbi:NAD(P)H-dependent flavin oxidoreductase [Variovorax sp. PBL-E5]|uniref:NAD(P)H-dependent flavin oxidoreductase n=1 Tax=Variovorax sp. PBL-E5 TaxID=434014 RepID=UPI001316E571|nr:nitronate monooxygenase family protein [Variovorax sp. PBL-E5]VTU29494.1 Nitronate monooxygenase [Variovorax sp. PBL-E5]